MEIRQAKMEDWPFWSRLDKHLPQEEYARKVRDGRAYVLLKERIAAGLMRYNFLWDSIPFCTLLMVEKAARCQGAGTALMMRWEKDMRAQGHGLLMVSTQTDEDAQHFYRRLGYRDAGGLVMDVPGYEQAMELFLVKAIGRNAIHGANEAF